MKGAVLLLLPLAAALAPQQGHTMGRMAPRMGAVEATAPDMAPRQTKLDIPRVLNEVNPVDLTAVPIPAEDKELRETMLGRAYKRCQTLTSIYAKTFYLGTRFMRPEQSNAVWAIYVWCRRTDDIVDNPRAILSRTKERDLEEWTDRLHMVFQNQPLDELDLALAETVQLYPRLSKQPFLDMIDGMLMDLPDKGKNRYNTFEELYLYCYRVAGTVGVMTLPVLGAAEGYTLDEALSPALALGTALQLTNIIRDVGEDLLRGRIYLPLEDLERFGVTEADVLNRRLTPQYKELIKFQIKRARAYFREAEKGIPMLAEGSRLPVRASLDMYSQILDAVEANNYDNLRKRAYVSKLQKFLALPQAWYRTVECPKPEQSQFLEYYPGEDLDKYLPYRGVPPRPL